MTLADRSARADMLCAFMVRMRPDLPSMSLDAWVAEHREKLTPQELRAATAILDLHPDYATP